MNKDLTTSGLHRKNVLNNSEALYAIYDELSFPGIMFEGKYRFTKKQIAEYFEVDNRTIERYVENHKEEFKDTGYEILSGEDLNKFKDAYGSDINVVTVDKSLKSASVLGVFTFKSFLNVGMLMTNSEKAKDLRAFILDIVIDFINQKAGGNTKYINQREEEFLSSAIREYNYREEFTNAIDYYIKPNKYKYGQLTNKVYQSIFKEKTKEYKQVLKLGKKDSAKSTMYSEVLDLIASYENGFADFLKKRFEETGQKLKLSEANKLFDEFENSTNKIYEPLREKVRSLMASRDMAFRDALHEKLSNYVTHVSAEEFDKFLGDKSMDLEQRILENIEVFKRLKDK